MKCIEVGINLQQCDQDKERKPGLVECIIWKSETKFIM